ncbi:MAG: ATP-grasp domain-containing protein [Coriobacteriia bacterium]|nr:ATP-grasp domain-containing protein [Coriobacteriia bacterium]
MKLGNDDFIPLLFASDITVYSLARAFHEAYGIVSKGYGIAQAGPLRYTQIIDYEARPKADAVDVLRGLVCDFAHDHPAQCILPIASGDNYVQALALAQERGLPENVCRHYLPFQEMLRLAHKQGFYALCDEAGIAHPQTFVYRESLGGQIKLDFLAPYIVKPTDSVAWWRHPFEGQRKVHLVAGPDELKALLSRIYAAGYPAEMIIQEFLPGPDTDLYVLTQYFDRASRPVLSAAGRVLLEEHTAHGIGNSAVIMTEQKGGIVDDLANRLADLLQGQGYRGFASFDLKFDQREQRLKVLELNTRQGRGNYYVTGAGANIAALAVDDIIYQKRLGPVFATSPFLWSVAPPWVAKSCSSDLDIQKKAALLVDTGQWANPLDYAADRGLRRWLWLRQNARLQVERFKDWRDSESEL